MAESQELARSHRTSAAALHQHAMDEGGQKRLSRTLFAETRELFQRATASTRGTTQRDYMVGGSHVRLCFATPSLIPHLTPALAHLSTPLAASTPDLTICLWDSVSSGSPITPSAWFPAGFSVAQEFRASNGTSTLAFNATTDVLNLLDLPQRVGFYWAADPRRIPDAEKGTPFLPFLQGLFASQGKQVLHAGVVGSEAGGVVLAGHGGAGKSTSALACLVGGMKYVSDDYCLLAPQAAPYAVSLFSSGKLGDDSLSRLPSFLPHVSNPRRQVGEKAMFFLSDRWAPQIAAQLPIRAVLLPYVTGQRDTRMQPTSAAAGVKALAPSTLFQLAGVGPAAFRMIAALLRQVPCYRLELGTDLEQIPLVIRTWLAEG